jgi:hypothetical protein
MSRSSAIAIENSFVNGLVTEASAVNFPENACTETFDCVFDQTGSVSRRRGFNIETNHSLREVDRTERAISTHLWKNVAGDGNISLMVVQIGETLYFYDASTNDPLSSHAIADTVDLTDFLPPAAPSPKTQECQFADGNGILFVFHPTLETFAVEYDSNTETFSETEITLTIRDFEGVDDSLDIDERPTVSVGSMSIAHHYNLLNQGWTATNLAAWDAAKTDMPSNCDVMWQFKNSSDAFDTSTIANQMRGNSPASKGHYVLDLYVKDRQTASGLTMADDDTGYQRCGTGVFFAGRVFYAGLNYVGENAKIFFSQIIERPEQYGQCYQLNDPTSEEAFDLLPSDGGVIQIQEAGSIIKMVSVAGGLAVFCSNGIWVISGSTGLGFTANDYSVRKVSTTSALTASSFVNIGGNPTWWNLEGIYMFSMGAGEGVQIQSLTEKKIRSFYQSIPPSAKRTCTGYFNTITGVVQWLFKNTESGTIEETYEPTHVLCFDINTGAFYPWTIADNVKLHACVVLENLGGAVSIDNVIADNGDNVQSDAGDDVVVYTINNAIVTPSFKYLVSYLDEADDYQFTFAEENDERYLDWYTYDEVGQNYASYFVTGYKIHGDAIRKFQSNYVRVFSLNDVPTQYVFSSIWNFATNTSTGKWSNPQTVTHDTDNYGYVSKRLKIRGHGHALQYYVYSTTGNPFHIVGWSAFESANASI